MSLRIFLLGQFYLQADDKPLALPSRKAQSLLAYLALCAGADHRREKLAGLLWPDATEANARSYLRQALWRIRKYLDLGSIDCEEYLRISDISIAFNDRSDFWLDARLLQEPAAGLSLEDLAAIVVLYQGELLPGFYDEWIVPERERLQVAYHQKMNLLLESMIEVERWEEAVEWSEQWIRFGHSPEPAFRALLKSYGGLGDQVMISATYQRCLDSLNRELGLDPSTETRRLYERLIQDDQSELALSATGISDLDVQPSKFLDELEPYPVEKPVFVARERELRQLDFQLDQALTGQGRVVFVTGEAGSGKTALVNEFTHRAQEDHAGLVVANGSCSAYTSIGDPYLPFREILAQLTGDVESLYAAGAITLKHAQFLLNTLPHAVHALVKVGPDLIRTFIPGSALLRRAKASDSIESRWLSQLTEVVESKMTGAIISNPQQTDIFEQYSNTLCSLSREVPLVLVLDDLQWADLGSISMLFHLGRNLRGSRILIICIYRQEEVALGREGARHPLEAVVNELQREFGNAPVEMDKTHSRDFVKALVDHEPNRLGLPFKEMIYRQSRGHALFTVELLRGMQERGELVQDQDGWWIEGLNLDWDILPVRVEAVVAERIGRLAEPLQAALRTASVEGDLFTAEVVAQVHGTAAGELLRQMSRELDRRHHLIRSHSILRKQNQLLSRYRFRHTLFQKFLYNSIDEVERVHLHQQVGIALERFYGTEEEVNVGVEISPQLARHFQEAGLTDKAIHYSHRAGDRAVQLSAFQEGVVHLNNGLAMLESQPPSPDRDERELELQLSLGRAFIGKIPGPEWKGAINRASALCQRMGKTKQLCQVLGELSIHHYVRAEYRQAREFGEEALSLALQIGEPLLVALNHWHLGFILFGSGKYTAAQNHLEEIISFYNPQEHHHPFLLLRPSDPGASALAYSSCSLWCLGFPDQAAKRRDKAFKQARELEHPLTLADVLCYGGCVLNAMFRNISALQESAEELLRTSEELGFASWKANGIGYLGYSIAMTGRVEEGITKLQEAIALRKSRNSRCYLIGLLCALAECLAEAGRLDEGLTTLTEAEALLEKSDERLSESEVYRLQGELHHLRGDYDQAEASLRRAIGAARRQEAKSWELRSAMSLAHLWMDLEQPERAHKLLAQIYGWFTEGFDTLDMIEAGELLEEISERIN